MAGLGALRQLDFDHLDLRVRCLRCELIRVEPTLFVTATEVTSSDLPNQIPAMLPVVARDTTLASVVGKAAFFGAKVHCLNCSASEGAEAHRRDVEDRRGVGLRAIGSADGDTHILASILNYWVWGNRVRHPGVFRVVDILLGSKGLFVCHSLGTAIHQRSSVPIKRLAVGVVLD